MTSPTITGFTTNETGERPVELYWERFGPDDGEPLLLVNGLGSPCVSYEVGFIEQLLARGFAVVRFDNRDVGRSTRVVGSHPAERTYLLADMAWDAVTVLDAVGWDTAHVFGQSMGGMIVQQLAIAHSERLRTMTSLMSTTGNPDYGRPHDGAMSALMTPSPTEREAWLEHRVTTEKLWASPRHWDPAWVRSKGEIMWAHNQSGSGTSPDGPGRQFKAIQASGPRDEQLARIDVPSLVIHGSADTLIDPSGGRHTAEVIPGARYVEIEGMGHDLPPALWARLAAEVADWTACSKPD